MLSSLSSRSKGRYQYDKYFYNLKENKIIVLANLNVKFLQFRESPKAIGCQIFDWVPMEVQNLETLEGSEGAVPDDFQLVAVEVQTFQTVQTPESGWDYRLLNGR